MLSVHHQRESYRSGPAVLQSAFRPLRSGRAQTGVDSYPVLGKAVEVGGPQVLVPVECDVAVALVVTHNEDDIG